MLGLIVAVLLQFPRSYYHLMWYLSLHSSRRMSLHVTLLSATYLILIDATQFSLSREINAGVNLYLNINVKKLQFIHKLTSSDTSKAAKITKKGDITHQHIA